MKKAIRSFCICFIIIAMISTTAFAAAPLEPDSPQKNSYIFKTTVGIAALGGGEIEVDFSVTAMGKMTDVGATHVQIFNENGKCVKIYTHTDPGYSYMMGHNKYSHTASVFYQGVSGQRYYAIVTFYAGDLNGAGGEDELKSPAIYA